jgi:hypothetical protein
MVDYGGGGDGGGGGVVVVMMFMVGCDSAYQESWRSMSFIRVASC